MSLRDETNPRRPLVLVMSFLISYGSSHAQAEGRRPAKSVNHADVDALPATFLPLSLPFDVRFHDGAARARTWPSLARPLSLSPSRSCLLLPSEVNDRKINILLQKLLAIVRGNRRKWRTSEGRRRTPESGEGEGGREGRE